MTGALEDRRDKLLKDRERLIEALKIQNQNANEAREEFQSKMEKLEKDLSNIYSSANNLAKKTGTLSVDFAHLTGKLDNATILAHHADSVLKILQYVKILNSYSVFSEMKANLKIYGFPIDDWRKASSILSKIQKTLQNTQGNKDKYSIAIKNVFLRMHSPLIYIII